SRSASTTSCVGRIGVRLASTTKVATADRSASPTATRPTTRASQPDAGAVADAISAVTDCPTLVIDLTTVAVRTRKARWLAPLKANGTEAFIQHCCQIETNLRHLTDVRAVMTSLPPGGGLLRRRARVSRRYGTPGRRGRGSSCARCCD